jgi:electron transfer flavoprotein alpha subunit
MANVLAVCEQKDGQVRKVSREIVAAARLLADALGGTVDALVIGAPGLDAAGGDLGSAGADRVLVGTHDGFALYQPDGFAATAAAQAKAGGYAAVVLAATATGRDLAPRLAVQLDAPLAMDVTGLAVEGGKVVATRPVYAGKAIQTLTLDATPAVVAIRPNTFPGTSARPHAGTPEPGTALAGPGRTVVTELKAAEQGMLDVAEASIVVSGGRGMKGPEHFVLLEDLAKAIGGAAVGASRAVVDAGWRPHGEQVGQTGKTVSPQLYIAVGISGAIQHLAGMRTAKVIVAINKDKDAPIFKVADYGIVGDAFEIVPKLTEEVRKLRAG